MYHLCRGHSSKAFSEANFILTRYLDALWQILHPRNNCTKASVPVWVRMVFGYMNIVQPVPNNIGDLGPDRDN